MILARFATGWDSVILRLSSAGTGQSPRRGQKIGHGTSFVLPRLWLARHAVKWLGSLWTQRQAIQKCPNRAPARARRTPDACSGDRLQRQPEPEPALDRQIAQPDHIE